MTLYKMDTMIKEKIKLTLLKGEANLSEYATKSSDAVRLKKEISDIRPPFFRDIDRIIYSLSYIRYIDKTQVFSFNNNDHISKRIIHVQFVSKIARTIGRALNLNEDLIEAIALGHDLGHIPYGHVGEEILNEISLKYDGTYFFHNVQSVKTLMSIDNDGKGYNLTYQVLDGILCHNGELVENEYYPRKKTINDFLDEYHACYHNKELASKLVPSTLEGCVVRISDIIGYIGRDIEDAIRLGIIKKEDLPKDIVSLLGDNNSDIINTIVLDIIENSYGKPYIKMSTPIYNAIKKLKDFNYKNIYYKANTKEQIEGYKIMFDTLFTHYLKCLREKNKNSIIYKDFLDTKAPEYINSNSLERIVIDYIAGMTDDYFKYQYELIK